MSDSAVQIYQAYIDAGTDALWRREFDALAATMLYPNPMILLDGDLVVETAEEMARIARDFRDYLARMGTQDYVRLCVEARFDATDEARIIGSHETFMLRGGSYVVEPYRNQMTLERQDGVWKGAGVRALTENVSCTILSPDELRARTAASAHGASGQ